MRHAARRAVCRNPGDGWALAPLDIRRDTISIFPRSVASIRGVMPSGSWAFGSYFEDWRSDFTLFRLFALTASNNGRFL